MHEDNSSFLNMCENPGISKQEWRLILKGKKDFAKVSLERRKMSIAEGIPDKYRGRIWSLFCECQ